ncbi:FAD binding domain-containing protein [Aspergillus indologenus CBS 114.80]|uniref:FAD binding domain-containing protein n=1 Tax=Aspergillus indologenus CBS 114.80 TaxID=1450541 RepID=A0A2V5HXI6_9EURO|nr:FAD binding domain-containing protein [Aspergillus indologenus CBS 114.80]
MPPSISVIIVGAGLGGLATAIGLRRAGHQVTVLEKAPALGEIGAGIKVPPNSGRVFREWGLLDALEKICICPQENKMRSYRDGAVLSTMPLGRKSMAQQYNIPYYVVHRVDLHHLLAEAAQREGAVIELGVEVTGVRGTAEQAFVQVVANGTGAGGVEEEERAADLVLGADGERSRVRTSLLGHEFPWRDSGDHVFRATVPLTALEADEQLRALTRGINWWVGPRGNALTYPLKRGGLLNIVLTHVHPPDASVQFAPQSIAKEAVAAEFAGWDPLFHRLLDLTTTWARWTLLHTDMPSQWTGETGNIALLGDAAHAVLPYLAQGAALAFEDAAALSVLFGAMQDKAQIPDLLTVFEAIRQPRAREMRRRVGMARALWSMPDGPQQRERDRQLREHGHDPYDGYPNVLADPALTRWMFGYDAFEAAREAWRKFARGQFPGTRGTWQLNRESRD